MRKSNWFIVAILIVASIVFLALWYFLGFNFVDDPLDLVITIVWWLIVVVVCVAIAQVEKRRRRSIRTSFVAPGFIYNPEAGIVKVDEGSRYTPTLRAVLDELDYAFDRRDVANDKRIRFDYVVRSDKFSSGGDVWEGEVVKVSNPDDIRRFRNEFELGELIDRA